MASLIIITLSIIIIRVVVKNRKYKGKQVGIAKAYEQLVRRYRLRVDYSECINCRYIGLDRKNKKLLIIDHCSSQKKEQCISLIETGDCKIVREIDEADFIQSIFLELGNNGNGNTVQFCFYNRKRDSENELPSLFRKAIQWKTRIDIHKRSASIGNEAEYVL